MPVSRLLPTRSYSYSYMQPSARQQQRQRRQRQRDNANAAAPGNDNDNNNKRSVSTTLIATLASRRRRGSPSASVTAGEEGGGVVESRRRLLDENDDDDRAIIPSARTSDNDGDDGGKKRNHHHHHRRMEDRVRRARVARARRAQARASRSTTAEKGENGPSEGTSASSGLEDANHVAAETVAGDLTGRERTATGDTAESRGFGSADDAGERAAAAATADDFDGNNFDAATVPGIDVVDARIPTVRPLRDGIIPSFYEARFLPHGPTAQEEEEEEEIDSRRRASSSSDFDDCAIAFPDDEWCSPEDRRALMDDVLGAKENARRGEVQPEAAGRHGNDDGEGGSSGINGNSDSNNNDDDNDSDTDSDNGNGNDNDNESVPRLAQQCNHVTKPCTVFQAQNSHAFGETYPIDEHRLLHKDAPIADADDDIDGKDPEESQGTTHRRNGSDAARVRFRRGYDELWNALAVGRDDEGCDPLSCPLTPTEEVWLGDDATSVGDGAAPSSAACGDFWSEENAVSVGSSALLGDCYAEEEEDDEDFTHDDFVRGEGYLEAAARADNDDGDVDVSVAYGRHGNYSYEPYEEDNKGNVKEFERTEEEEDQRIESSGKHYGGRLEADGEDEDDSRGPDETGRGREEDPGCANDGGADSFHRRERSIGYDMAGDDDRANDTGAPCDEEEEDSTFSFASNLDYSYHSEDEYQEEADGRGGGGDGEDVEDDSLCIDRAAHYTDPAKEDIAHLRSPTDPAEFDGMVKGSAPRHFPRVPSVGEVFDPFDLTDDVDDMSCATPFHEQEEDNPFRSTDFGASPFDNLPEKTTESFDTAPEEATGSLGPEEVVADRGLDRVVEPMAIVESTQFVCRLPKRNHDDDEDKDDDEDETLTVGDLMDRDIAGVVACYRSLATCVSAVTHDSAELEPEQQRGQRRQQHAPRPRRSKESGERSHVVCHLMASTSSGCDSDSGGGTNAERHGDDGVARAAQRYRERRAAASSSLSTADLASVDERDRGWGRDPPSTSAEGRRMMDIGLECVGTDDGVVATGNDEDEDGCSDGWDRFDNEDVYRRVGDFHLHHDNYVRSKHPEDKMGGELVEDEKTHHPEDRRGGYFEDEMGELAGDKIDEYSVGDTEEEHAEDEMEEYTEGEMEEQCTGEFEEIYEDEAKEQFVDEMEGHLQDEMEAKSKGVKKEHFMDQKDDHFKVETFGIDPEGPNMSMDEESHHGEALLPTSAIAGSEDIEIETFLSIASTFNAMSRGATKNLINEDEEDGARGLVQLRTVSYSSDGESMSQWTAREEDEGEDEEEPISPLDWRARDAEDVYGNDGGIDCFPAEVEPGRVVQFNIGEDDTLHDGALDLIDDGLTPIERMCNVVCCQLDF